MSDVIAVFPIEREDSLICHGAALRKATRRVSQLYDAVLAPCGLKVSQHSILSHIARAGASMTDLARLLVLDRSALAHNLKPLVRDGYVRTTRDLRDGRSRRVALTDAGCEKLTQSRRLWTDAQARFEAAYGAERAVALRALAEIFSEDFALAFSRG